MRNPFVAAAAIAAMMASQMQHAAVTAFHSGVAPRGLAFGEGTGKKVRYHMTSHRTVAQDKRDSRKARNRARNKERT